MAMDAINPIDYTVLLILGVGPIGLLIQALVQIARVEQSVRDHSRRITLLEGDQ
jgi:threonine dehydrogenase-like Zn-dependent dehydrogenase